ncbi:MAG: transcriptional regulator, TetR family [Mycobacterium sp.]|jgi:AcrR family transcriptional regulator|nr:transcriptional regulator, TetR family [Mycobacterium sp.]
MALSDRRERERVARRRLIITTARRVAEAEGWDAVTTRRLSNEIEYSQPVLYKHFTGMDQIADAVAVDGFGELAEAMGAACSGRESAADALTRVARAYIDFARTNPAVYDAMFTRATSMHFATHDVPSQLTAAFAELRRVVDLITDDEDSDVLTEVLWAALHGLVTLSRADRLRPGDDTVRLRLLVAQFTARGEAR